MPHVFTEVDERYHKRDGRERTSHFPTPLSPYFILSLLSQEENTSSLHISNIFWIKHGKKMNNEEQVHPIFQILPKYVEIKS